MSRAPPSSYRVLADFVELLLFTVRRYRVTAPKDPKSWAGVVAEHDTLVAALRARDPEAAESAARQHVTSQSAEAGPA